MLGKLYAEVIESMDVRNVEAIKASGGNRLQTIWYGMLPQVIPEFSSYAMYRFEIDIRASTVLGIVGAGGIGAPLLLATRSEEHTSELQSRGHLVCRLLLEKKK